MATNRKAAQHFSTRIPVMIKRDITAITPRVIWAHERPILEEIFGPENVIDIDLPKLDEGYTKKVSPSLLQWNKKQDEIFPPSDSLSIGFIFFGDARAEFDRLKEVYGMHPEVKEAMVENVYGRFQDGRFERALGRAGIEDMPDQQLRALIGQYGYPAEVSKDSTVEERREHARLTLELRSMQREQLLKLCDELQVEIA